MSIILPAIVEMLTPRVSKEITDVGKAVVKEERRVVGRANDVYERE